MFSSKNLCEQLHAKIDEVDEERYDCEEKVSKHNKDVSYRQRTKTRHSIYNNLVMSIYENII